MLTVKKSAGVAPEVNLNLLLAGEKSTLTLKPRADVTRNPKKGYQWSHKKNLCPAESFKKEKFYINK